MSKNLEKLAHEIDGLVSGFLRKAQLAMPASGGGAAPMSGGDTNNDYPRAAIQAYLAQQTDATLNKWNQLLDKISDEAYNVVQSSTSLDLRVVATLAGNRYKVTIQPQVEPSRNREMEQALQPFMNGMAGVAGVAASKAYHPGNSSFAILRKNHLKF